MPGLIDGYMRVAKAHAMTPHLGSGAGQAIEVRVAQSLFFSVPFINILVLQDAYVLATLLTRPRTSQSTIPDVLRAYDSVRVPFSQFVVEGSRNTGLMYELNHGWDDGKDGPSKSKQEQDASPDNEMIRLRKLADATFEMLRWVWEDEKESQTEKAERLFTVSLNKGT